MAGVEARRSSWTPLNLLAETGEHVILPDARHALAALEDAAVLLTVVKPVP